jgi:hypothetical protein
MPFRVMVPVCRNRGCLYRGGRQSYQTDQGWNDHTHFSLCLGGQRGSVWASLLTKGETARWLRAPTHPSADLTRRQKRLLTSSERSDPNADSPNDPASGRGAHPTRILGATSSIGGAVPSSTGVAFAGGSGAACAETDARATKPASVAIVRISASIGDRWPECARQTIYNLSGRKSEPPALRWGCRRYVRALAFAAGDPVPSLTA